MHIAEEAAHLMRVGPARAGGRTGRPTTRPSDVAAGGGASVAPATPGAGGGTTTATCTAWPMTGSSGRGDAEGRISLRTRCADAADDDADEEGGEPDAEEHAEHHADRRVLPLAEPAAPELDGGEARHRERRLQPRRQAGERVVDEQQRSPIRSLPQPRESAAAREPAKTAASSRRQPWSRYVETEMSAAASPSRGAARRSAVRYIDRRLLLSGLQEAHDELVGSQDREPRTCTATARRRRAGRPRTTEPPGLRTCH